MVAFNAIPAVAIAIIKTKKQQDSSSARQANEELIISNLAYY
jgi:hypothetical protein